MVDGEPTRDFVAVAARLDGVEGWFTLEQARALHEAVQQLEPGQQVVEIGSFRGRSTIVSALTAAPGVVITAIDPHAGNDRGPNELDGYEAEASEDHAVFTANLAAQGVTERVHHVRSFSHDALATVGGRADVLLIDGAHRYGPARADIRDWGARVPDGGTLLVHDAFSSIGVTLAIGRELLASRRFRFQGRVGSLAVYRAEPVAGGADRLANAWSQLANVPWFARNVVVKALLVAGLGRVARLLGHDGATWPY